MERKFIGRDILEWMIGYYVLLAIVLKSILLPIVFLLPLFYIWRAINRKQLTITENFRDKSITKSQMKGQKFLYGFIFVVVCIVFAILIAAYLLFGEYYWLNYVAMPAASAIGDFCHSVGEFFNGTYADWLESSKEVTTNADFIDQAVNAIKNLF